ncbi:dTMP kinase [Ferrimicrobium sp.]|uniref:dTMP kinase n=1 Tax=Ferrimicrobium sp. TaxID=2926050 RepID=UPI00262652A6|nr:dTMP kinase [Ferrimicrobium sp.]
MDDHHRGALVVLEGPDRVGKSTQVERLAQWFRGRGRSVSVSREPGGDALGEAIRTMLLGESVDGWTELFLFLAVRARHLSSVIEPALSRGELVILDRYTPSTLVYQGAQLGEELVTQLATLPVFREPDATIVLDCREPLAALDSADRFEHSGLTGWHERRNGYRALARRHGWLLISGDGPPELVTKRLVETLVKRVTG